MAKLPRITRRRFNGSLATGAAGLFLYAWRVEPHGVQVVERDLAIANLPQALVSKLAEVGVRTLRNECQDVAGLQLVRPS